MKRSSHTFQFSGAAIAEAAKAEHDYHADRVEWWRSKQEDAIAKAKAAGIDVREFDVSGGKQVQVVVDPSITERLSQCASKIQSHQNAADRFQIEAAAYSTQPDRVYECEPDDVVYFRLAGGPRDV